MELLKDLGLFGFLFFLIKGMVWLVLIALAYYGLISKEQMQRIRTRLRFWKRNGAAEK
ncbi:MAG TPA: hypothetical protein PLX35_14710 [Cyclobacteriaceae bacterium]|nr:hypothetical protein [Cyclobacteriaceae bacterium]